MTNQSWEPQTAEEILDAVKKEIKRLSKSSMHRTPKSKTKHKGFKNNQH